MSGAPTEAEIQAQWRAGIDIIETLRNHFDGTIAGAGGKLDTLTQILEGEYLPAEYTRLMGQVRAQASDMVSPAYASQVITPALFEYGKILAADATYGLGAGYRAPGDIFASLYDWFHDKSLSVTSRGITFDTTPTAGGSNVGNGTISRLTIDENAYNIEACTIEKKQFVCRADQNSGTEEHAETFEMIGEPSSFDSLLRGSFGSGDAARTVITSKHAGTGSGGSLLQNSSFSQYAAGSSPKFTGWTETAGGNHISQDATNFYRSHPNATTNASLKMTGSHGTLTVTQPLSAMRVRRLEDRDHFGAGLGLGRDHDRPQRGLLVQELQPGRVLGCDQLDQQHIRLPARRRRHLLALGPDRRHLLVHPAERSLADLLAPG